MTQSPTYLDVLAKATVPTPKARQAMTNVGIDFAAMNSAVAQASQAFRALAVDVANIGRKMADGLAIGLKPMSRTISPTPIRDKRKEAYLRRASRLNARPRQPKRHGERRGVK